MNSSSSLPLAIITGGTSGIGFAVADALKKNYQVALIFKENKSRAIEAIKKLDHSSNCKYWQINIENDESVRQGLKDLFSHYNQSPKILINAAALLEGPEFFVQQKNLEIHKRLMNTNYFGSLRMIQEVLPQMYRHKQGCIVNISSISAEGGIKGFSAYSGSKIALEALTKNLAAEVGHRGISVNCVRPGLTATPMSQSFLEKHRDDTSQLNFPLGRALLPAEVAQTILHIIDMSPMINGQVISIDGGYSALRRQTK